MTQVLEPPLTTTGRRIDVEPGSRIWRWITTTDHKVIGYLYIITSFMFFLAAGLMAEIIRTELARPGLQFLSEEQYNPAVHHARHDHAAVLRDAAVRRLQKLHHAAAALQS